MTALKLFLVGLFLWPRPSDPMRDLDAWLAADATRMVVISRRPVDGAIAVSLSNSKRNLRVCYGKSVKETVGCALKGDN